MMDWFRETIESIILGYHSFTDAVYWFLCDIQFGNVLYLAVQLLFTAFFLSSLVNMVMTLISPQVYDAKHRQVLGNIGRNTYWMALLLEFVLWCVDSSGILALMGSFNAVVAVITGGLALVGYMAAVVTMIFARHGKRSYIASALGKLGNSLMLLGLLLLIITLLLF